MESKLVAETLKLLRSRPREVTLRDIAHTTGIPESWLKMFSSGRIEEPAASRIETLYEHLSGKKILA